jgi:two-component system, sensor histidine kinase
VPQRHGILAPELLRNALESAPDAIVIVNADGRIVFASSQVAALFGYDPNELVGEPVERLLPERFRAVHLGHRKSYASSARMRPMGIGLDLYALRKDGTELPVEISLSPIHDGQQTVVAAAIRDVSERKRIQAALTHAREDADRANQAKSRFLATASHDLRQPLQTLALLNGTLSRIVKDPTAAEAVEQQGQAVDAMSRLLNALLDISKLESGAIQPDPSDFAVAALFEQLRVEFASLAASKGLTLEVDPAAERVHSDASLIGQILRNLVSNAIKYTRQGSVRLRALARPPDVRIEVADTGVGIAADQLPYIYDEFYQVGVASNTAREGYGLGLSIVRRLVTLLGLRLDVHSEVGRGSVFAIEIPQALRAAAPSERAPGRGAAATHGPAGSPRILLVDDDAGVRNATSMLLKVEGYRVLAAASLEEAARGARENPDIELLITDYHLAQGETGIDVMAAVRTVVGGGLKAILVTGDTSSMIHELEADERTRLASKPVNAEELLGLIEALLASPKG